ncbi:MAG TPA: ArsA-related P-loop ATPase [Actinomycetales bacterium]|nr:ArsA-related P-loop ATPase [Actinomycetales bacterium]
MRVLLLAGKGGAGTTTLAAATAVATARCGVKSLLVSTGDDSAFADVLSGPARGHGPHEVEPGLSVLPGAAAEQLSRSWPTLRKHLSGLFGGLDLPTSEALSLLALPGARDVLSLLTLRQQVDEGQWDLVIVDGGTHLPRLLSTPAALTRLVDRVWTPERRAGLDGGCPDPALSEATARLRDELGQAVAVLRARTTSVRLVLTPDSAGLAWTRRSLTALGLQGYGVDGVLANRVLPGGGDDPWRTGQVDAQSRVLAEAEALAAPQLVRRLPYLTREPADVDELAELGRRVVAGPERGAAVAAAVEQLMRPLPESAQADVRRDGDAYDLVLTAPLVRASDLDLRRDGDELRVRVHGEQLVVVLLPSVLRRCLTTGATVAGGRLVVHFVRDPQQWPAPPAGSTSSATEEQP